MHKLIDSQESTLQHREIHKGHSLLWPQFVHLPTGFLYLNACRSHDCQHYLITYIKVNVFYEFPYCVALIHVNQLICASQRLFYNSTLLCIESLLPGACECGNISEQNKFP